MLYNNQKFKIPVYVVVTKYLYDDEYTMIGYSFDLEEAKKIALKYASKLADELGEQILDSLFCEDGTSLDVGSYSVSVDEREILV